MATPKQSTHRRPVAPRRPAAAPTRRKQAIPATAARVAPTARDRGKVRFAMLFCVVIAVMVLTLVSLKALLAQQSFAVDDLSKGIDALEGQHLELASEQAQLSAPGRIADWARRSGMRFPDDIRLLHVPDASTAPAGAGTSGGGA